MNPLWEAMKRGHAKAQARVAVSGENLDDMTFSLGGEVQSIQELNAKGTTMPFVCMRTSTPAAVPNSHRLNCDRCRAEVWMSPGTKETFDKLERKLVICMECFEAIS